MTSRNFIIVYDVYILTPRSRLLLYQADSSLKKTSGKTKPSFILFSGILECEGYVWHSLIWEMINSIYDAHEQFYWTDVIFKRRIEREELMRQIVMVRLPHNGEDQVSKTV